MYERIKNLRVDKDLTQTEMAKYGLPVKQNRSKEGLSSQFIGHSLSKALKKQRASLPLRQVMLSVFYYIICYIFNISFNIYYIFCSALFFISFQHFRFISLLPRQIKVISSKVSVGCCLLIDGTP